MSAYAQLPFIRSFKMISKNQVSVVKEFINTTAQECVSRIINMVDREGGLAFQKEVRFCYRLCSYWDSFDTLIKEKVATKIFHELVDQKVKVSNQYDDFVIGSFIEGTQLVVAVRVRSVSILCEDWVSVKASVIGELLLKEPDGDWIKIPNFFAGINADDLRFGIECLRALGFELDVRDCECYVKNF